MRINNIVELRSFVAEQLENLCEGTMKPEHANACAMLSANMLLSIRLEMEYARLQHAKPNVDFMEKGKNLIEGTSTKILGKKK